MATGKHVLDFALLPPADVAQAALALLPTLRPRPSARPAPAARLHVSLNALGAFQRPPGAVIDKATQAAAGVRAAPFDVALDRVGTCPAGDPPCLVASGDEGVIGVSRLYSAIHKALVRAGMVPRREAGIVPHMALVHDRARVPETFVEPLTWRATEFVLIHAIPGEGRFEIAARFPLSV